MDAKQVAAARISTAPRPDSSASVSLSTARPSRRPTAARLCAAVSHGDLSRRRGVRIERAPIGFAYPNALDTAILIRLLPDFATLLWIVSYRLVRDQTCLAATLWTACAGGGQSRRPGHGRGDRARDYRTSRPCRASPACASLLRTASPGRVPVQPATTRPGRHNPFDQRHERLDVLVFIEHVRGEHE